MVQKDNKTPPVRIPKPAMPTQRHAIFLGALVGSTSAFLMSTLFLYRFGLIFSLQYSVVILILDAFIGTIVAMIAVRHGISPWITLAVTAFAGFITPICLVLFIVLRHD